MMARIYMLPGLGTDRRLFNNLRKEGMDFEVIEFIRPLPQESLPEYAKRMAEKIDTTQPFNLVGVSFGGIVTSEIAKITRPDKVIFISTVKSSREFPFYLKIFRYLPAHKLLPRGGTQRMASAFLLKTRWPGRIIMAQMLRDSDPEFFHWALNGAIHWKSKTLPPNFIHLHGTADRLFPSCFVKNKISIPKGKHGMLISRSSEVAHHLRTVLN